MEVKKIVIHELIKEQNKKEAHAFLSNSVLQISTETIDLVEKLDKSFKKDYITYALFNYEEGTNFPNLFQAYNQSEKTNDLFISFTKSALLKLKDVIQGVIFAKGGYLVFTEYEINNATYIGVYLIRDEKGILFNKNAANKSFTINPVKYLNTNKLAMGCRINIDRYVNNDGKYIAMIKNNLTDFSDYFNYWISIFQPESSTEYTDALYQIISNINAPINPDTDEQYTVDEYRKKVHDYIKTRPNKIVNIPELSSYFYQDDTYISKYADENNIILDSEFKVDGRSLKKFWRLDINADGIQLKFSKGDFRTKVKISEENPNLIFIESSRFANKLRSETQDL